MSFGNVAKGFSQSLFTNPLNWFNPSYQMDALNTAIGASDVEAPAVAPFAPIKTVESDDALKNAAKLEAERLRRRKGMKSTILTQDSTLMSGVQTGKAEALG